MPTELFVDPDENEDFLVVFLGVLVVVANGSKTFGLLEVLGGLVVGLVAIGVFVVVDMNNGRLVVLICGLAALERKFSHPD